MADDEGVGSRLIPKVWLLAVAVLPPFAAGAQWRSEIGRHPVLAASLAVAYELALILVAFAAKVFGDLQDRWVTDAAGKLDQVIRGRLSRFEHRYLRYLEEIHRFTDLKGLATRGGQTPRLEEVFVDVSLAPRPLHEIGRTPWVGPDQPVADRTSLSRLLESPQPTVLAVIGAPGSGKTTLLEHTTIRLAHSRSRRRKHRTLPVLLFLRDHSKAIVENPDATLADRIRATLADLKATEAPGWFEEQLGRGRCLVMLDGLDEVALKKDRGLLVDWVERQIARYPSNDWVLTSRPGGYRSTPLNRAQVLQIRRFTGDQISRFLQRWYLAVEQISTGSDDAAVRRHARQGAEDLLDRLRDRPMLYDLAANPLLLTMIANVHRYRGTLPGSRADLYAEICQVLLWRRNEAKRVDLSDDEITGARKETVLRELAYMMMNERTRDLSADRSEAVLRGPLDRIGFNGAAFEFLAVVTASGLLVEREMSLFSFAHQTFQEHLAAAHVREHHLTATLTAAVSDSWWRETILLWAARTDASAVVEACIDRGGVEPLSLAFECMEESTTLLPATRARIEAIRQQALQAAPGSEQWRLMTAITVDRHLREVIRLSDDTLICAAPISMRIFRLFAAEHAAFRTQPAVQAGGEEVSAVAMDAVAARAFVHWINGLVGGTTRYRLPSDHALTDGAFQAIADFGDRPVWVAPSATQSDDVPGLWLPHRVDHPWMGTAQRVRERLRHDGLDTLKESLALLHARACSLALAACLVVARRNDHLLELDLAHGSRLETALQAAVDRVPDHEISRFLRGSAANPRTDGFARGLALATLSHATPTQSALSASRLSALAIARTLAPAVTRALGNCQALPGGFDPLDGFDVSAADGEALAGPAIVMDAALDGILASADGRSTVAPLLPVPATWLQTSTAPTPTMVPELLAATVSVLALQLMAQVGELPYGLVTDPLSNALDACVRHAGAPTASEVLSVDALRERLTTMTALVNGQGAGAPWPAAEAATARLLADRLAEATHILLQGGAQAPRSLPRSVRIGALALAAAAERLSTTALGEACRTIAMVITVLQDQQDGILPATQTMYLARV